MAACGNEDVDVALDKRNGTPWLHLKRGYPPPIWGCTDDGRIAGEGSSLVRSHATTSLNIEVEGE